jgi:ATPase subunit of ABC transporter with duplicated ATPase domains
MNQVGKVVPPKREILKDISLSFFPGAKIGVLGLNGSGKSTLLKIMAGLDNDILGEARAMADINIGYLRKNLSLIALKMYGVMLKTVCVKPWMHSKGSNRCMWITPNPMPTLML